MAFSISEITSSLGKAANVLQEYKRLDLHEAVVLARTKLVEIQNDLLYKDDRIKQLEEALRRSPNLRRGSAAYYEWFPDNQCYDRNPYCSRCWEVDHLAVHLTQIGRENKSVCPQCKSHIDFRDHYETPEETPDGKPLKVKSV